MLLADIDMKKFLLHNIQLAVSLFLFLSLGNVGNVFWGEGGLYHVWT